MLTRSKFNELKNTDSLECLCCGGFWGTRESLYVCSKCNGNKSIDDKVRINYNKDIVAYQKKRNMVVIDNNAVSHLVKILQKTLILVHGAFDVANLIHKYMQAFQKVNNPDNKIFLLNDEQAIRVLKASNWREYPKGYQISHIILRWRLNPWSMLNSKEYHLSSFCYYGNFGEVPGTVEHLDGLYARAHSDSMMK